MLNDKVWKKLLVSEIAFVFAFEVINIIIYFVRDFSKINSLPFFLAIITLIICPLILWTLKPNAKQKSRIKKFIQILAALYFPFVLETIWLMIFGFLTNHTANIKWLEFIIFIIGAIIYLVMWLPIVMAFFSQIKNPVMKIIAFLILLEEATGLSSWHVAGLSFLNVFTISNLLGAIAFFIAACCMTYSWGYRLNPNLKFKLSENWSFGVLTILILYALVDIVWNIISGQLSNIINTKFLSSAFYFNGKILGTAITTGLLEETFRYLLLIVLLEWLAKRKNYVIYAVITSAIIFGLAHLLNVFHEPIVDAFLQIILNIGAGLAMVLLYLYTGKLWAIIIYHAVYDYFIFLQPIGVTTSNTIFMIYLIICLIAPILLTVWMLTGKRYQVLQENADRLMLKQRIKSWKAAEL